MEVRYLTQSDDGEQSSESLTQDMGSKREPWRDWGSDENVRGDMLPQELRDKPIRG